MSGLVLRSNVTMVMASGIYDHSNFLEEPYIR